MGSIINRIQKPSTLEFCDNEEKIHLWLSKIEYFLQRKSQNVQINDAVNNLYDNIVMTSIKRDGVLYSFKTNESIAMEIWEVPLSLDKMIEMINYQSFEKKIDKTNNTGLDGRIIRLKLIHVLESSFYKPGGFQICIDHI